MSAFFGPPAFLWSCKMRSFSLLAALVALSTAQIPFGPGFPVSQYFSDERGQQLIHLSANILTSPGTPSFNGSIEVDITADDPSSKNAAEFGSDYIVNLHSAIPRTFTVVFQSNQANSTEHAIHISEDAILEGDETFRLRIVAARFMGQAAAIFRAEDGLTNTFAEVIIKDDDFVNVNWMIAQSIEVTEGYEVEVRLRARAFGFYENPIEIGIVCAAATSTGVDPALPGSDYSFAVGTKLNFTDVETFSSFSLHDLVIPIIDDDIAEQCESFICTLQGGDLDAVRASEPSQVTIRISDDDSYDKVPVSFSQSSYSVSEGERSTTITLKTLANHTFSFSVTVSTREGTASSTADYSHKRTSLTFEAGVNLITFTVTIRDEKLAEPTEELYIDLESLSSSAVIKGCPSSATVYILNDDSLTLRFERDMYMVDESDGLVSIRVIASRRSSFKYAFTVTPMDLTATNNNDYLYPTTTYSFGPTDENEPIPSFVISIPIINDDDNEFDEDFKLTLEVSVDGEAANVTEGPISMTVVLIKDDDESMNMQLYLGPVTDCLTWVESNGDAKLSNISAALSVPLQQQCSCSLSVQQSYFSCANNTDSQTVVFLAQLSYTALPGVDMPSLLTSWVNSTPYITVASTQLQVDTTCPVVINSLEPESCPVTSVAPPTESPTETVTVIVTIFGIVILIVVTAIVAIVIAVVVCCRKQSKNRSSFPLPSPMYEDEYVDKGDVALAMTRNPSYMTAKEVMSVRFARGTEENKEVDRTYEVVSLEANKGGHEGTTSAAGGGQKALVCV